MSFQQERSDSKGLDPITESKNDMIKAARGIVEPYLSTLTHLLRFLGSVVEHEASNKMTRTNVAIIFGPSLFKSTVKGGERESLDSTQALAENFLHVKWTEFLLGNFSEIYEPGVVKVGFQFRFTKTEVLTSDKIESKDTR